MQGSITRISGFAQKMWWKASGIWLIRVGCYLVCRMEGEVENQKGMKWKDFDLDLGERRKSKPTRWVYS